MNNAHTSLPDAVQEPQRPFPAPVTPPQSDLRGLPFMPLDTCRIMSGFWHICRGQVGGGLPCALWRCTAGSSARTGGCTTPLSPRRPIRHGRPVWPSVPVRPAAGGVRRRRTAHATAQPAQMPAYMQGRVKGRARVPHSVRGRMRMGCVHRQCPCGARPAQRVRGVRRMGRGKVVRVRWAVPEPALPTRWRNRRRG